MLHIQVFTLSPIQENTYVVYNEQKDCIIFDPGCYFEEEREQLKEFIKENQLTPKFLVNTHCHLDHVFGNKFIAESYSLTPYIHSSEKVVLEFAPTAGLMYNLPFDNYNGALNFIDEKDTLQLGNDTFSIIHAPGHSPGSLCFYNKEHGLMIGGDVLFYRSIGRTDLPLGNHQQLIDSIKNKVFALPDETVVYSGHGQPTTIGDEKIYNPFVGSRA
jgi:hydroxyacylglutathione hydrolase